MDTREGPSEGLRKALWVFYETKLAEATSMVTRARLPNTWEGFHLGVAGFGLIMIARGVDLIIKHYHLLHESRREED